MTDNTPQAKPSGVTRLLFVLLPLALLAGLAFGIIQLGKNKDLLPVEIPPIEELSIQKITLQPHTITLDVMNDGADDITIAQVLVDEAFWTFSMEPENKTLKYLESGTIKIINYHWVEGDAYEVVLISRNGVTWAEEIPVALMSPTPTGKSFLFFVVVGVLIGVIPVALGLMWYPVLPYLSDRWLRFLMALTVGLLLFLGLDTVEEGLEFAEHLPASYSGSLLFFSIGFLVFFLLMVLDSSRKSESIKLASTTGERSSGIPVAWAIALGIGLHNLGEGLAVGSAYVTGEAALGATLILGFTLHNITEGLAIVTPIAKERVGIGRLLGFGALAGLPTIAGTLIGGFIFSQFWGAGGARCLFYKFQAELHPAKAPGPSLLF